MGGALLVAGSARAEDDDVAKQPDETSHAKGMYLRQGQPVWKMNERLKVRRDEIDAPALVKQPATWSATTRTRRARSTALRNAGETPRSVILSLFPFCFRS